MPAAADDVCCFLLVLAVAEVEDCRAGSGIKMTQAFQSMRSSQPPKPPIASAQAKSMVADTDKQGEYVLSL